MDPPSRRVPPRRRRPPSGFLTSRRFAPHVAWRVCFTPLSTSRLPPSGPFSSRGAGTPSGALLPSCRYHRTTSRRRSSDGPSSGPCSPRESVALRQTVKPAGAQCPPGVHPLQGLPSFGRRPCFHGPPLSCLPSGRTGRPNVYTTGSSRTEGPAVSRETACPPEVRGLFKSSPPFDLSKGAWLIVSPQAQPRVATKS